MSTKFSNKIILVTDKPRIKTPIRIALSKLGLDLVPDYPALTSISVMKTGIARSGKTAFIRTELLRFIKENGYPRGIIMDSQIDLGTAAGPDPDQLKIFKTLLIAYVILAKGAEFKGLRGNFILLTKGMEFTRESGLATNPHAAMKLLSTTNPEIQVLIDELKNEQARFDALFSIALLDTDLSSNEITDAVVNFLVSSGQHMSADAGTEETPSAAAEPAQDGEAEPARIVFRIDAGSVYDNGDVLAELTDEHLAMREKEFYIIGNWTSSTELAVSKKIAEVIEKGINENARFALGDVITFNLDDRCIMDKNTTLNLAQLFKKNLAKYKKISITASSKNGALIQKSRGYPMIKDILKILADTE